MRRNNGIKDDGLRISPWMDTRAKFDNLVRSGLLERGRVYYVCEAGSVQSSKAGTLCLGTGPRSFVIFGGVASTDEEGEEGQSVEELAKTVDEMRADIERQLDEMRDAIDDIPTEYSYNAITSDAVYRLKTDLENELEEFSEAVLKRVGDTSAVVQELSAAEVREIWDSITV